MTHSTPPAVASRTKPWPVASTPAARSSVAESSVPTMTGVPAVSPSIPAASAVKPCPTGVVTGNTGGNASVVRPTMAQSVGHQEPVVAS